MKRCTSVRQPTKVFHQVPRQIRERFITLASHTVGIITLFLRIHPTSQRINFYINPRMDDASRASIVRGNLSTRISREESAALSGNSLIDHRAQPSVKEVSVKCNSLPKTSRIRRAVHLKCTDGHRSARLSRWN